MSWSKRRREGRNNARRNLDARPFADHDRRKLARWLKSEGDDVSAGDVIAEIETDKATMEVEAVDEGKLGRILVAEGAENVAVNTPIAVIIGEGESADDAVASPAPAAEVNEPAPAAGRRTRPTGACHRTGGNQFAARTGLGRRDSHFDGSRSVTRRNGGRNASGRQRLSYG